MRWTLMILFVLVVLAGCEKKYVTRPQPAPTSPDTTVVEDDDDDEEED